MSNVEKLTPVLYVHVHVHVHVHVCVSQVSSITRLSNAGDTRIAFKLFMYESTHDYFLVRVHVCSIFMR